MDRRCSSPIGRGPDHDLAIPYRILSLSLSQSLSLSKHPLNPEIAAVPPTNYNFHIMAETKFGTFQDLMDITASDMQPIAQRLREIVIEIDPDTVEVVRLGDRAATYGVGLKKNSETYVYIMPHKNWVNLGFYQGVDLPDPAGLMEGTGKKLRHIKIRSLQAAGRPEVRTLIKEALAERQQALGK